MLGFSCKYGGICIENAPYVKRWSSESPTFGNTECQGLAKGSWNTSAANRNWHRQWEGISLAFRCRMSSLRPGLRKTVANLHSGLIPPEKIVGPVPAVCGPVLVRFFPFETVAA